MLSRTEKDGDVGKIEAKLNKKKHDKARIAINRFSGICGVLTMVLNPRLNYERFLLCPILVFICSIVSRRLCVEQSQSLASTSIVLSEL